MKKEYSDILYSGAQFRMDTVNDVVMRTMGAASYGTSMAARAKTGMADGRAKVSSVALAVDYLFLRQMNVASLPSMAYVEYTNKSGESFKATCDGNKIHFAGAVPSNPNELVVPLLAYAISNNSRMTVTRDAFEALKTTFTTAVAAGEGKEDVYRLCDAFYYEFKALVSESALSKDIEYDEFLASELLQQAARTGQVQSTNALSGLTMPAMEILDITKKKEDEATAKDNKNKFSSYRVGDYLIDHVWDPERQAYIPDLSILDDFVPDPSFYTMAELMNHELKEVKKRMDKGVFDYRAIGENYVNAQLIGRPGTGKTTVANALAAVFGLPIRVIINSKNTEEDSFQGMTKVQEGNFRFVETPFLDAYKNGGIILLEEMNLTDPGVTMGVLGQALEKPFILLEDGYREVRRHPLCVVIATANTGTQGAREPSEALTSRMPNVFLLDDPEEERFIEILKAKNKKITKKDCKKVYKAYTKVLAYLTSSSVNAEDVALSLCLRHCLAALKQMEIGIPFKDALKNTLIGTIGIKDLDLARDVQSNVIDVLV